MRKNNVMGIMIIAISIVMLSACASDYEVGGESFVSEEINSDTLVNLNQKNEMVENGSEQTISMGDEEGSLRSLFKNTDPYWNESLEYTNAVMAYDELIGDIYQIAADSDFSSIPHLATAYIDKDDIPELLVAYGNGHPCGVSVYKYDQINMRALYIGSFGSYGRLSYYEKSGIIESYYGNMGCYSYYATKVNDDGSISLVDAWLVNESGFMTEETHYYHHGYTIIGSFPIDGSRESFERNSLNDMYVYGNTSNETRITEEEYLDGKYDWLGVDEYHMVSVSYDEMFSI